MLVAGRKVGISREWLQDEIGLEKIGEYAFDSDRKMMSVIYEQGTRIKNDQTFMPGSTFILAKGAPERILKNCTSYLPHSTSGSYKDLPNLSSSPLSDEIVEKISNESSSMAHLGLRVLAFAIRIVTSSEASEIIKSNKSVNSETNLTFVGLIGLIGMIQDF
jgi:Ca2+-transporting ATPase